MRSRYFYLFFCIKQCISSISAVFWSLFFCKINKLWAQTSLNCELTASKVIMVYIFIAMAQEEKLSIDKLSKKNPSNTEVARFQK